MSGEIEVRPYRPGDEQGILDSFNLVFREVCGEGFVDRDMAYWRWQFLDNPVGHRIWVAVADDGTIAAHYGGMSFPIHTAFGETVFSQAVDSFAHPAYRRGLKKKGLFVEAGRRWFEDCEARGDWMTSCCLATDLDQDIAGQTRQILAVFDDHLAAAGSDRSSVLFAQVWLKRMSDLPAMNAVWNAWVDPQHPPARSCVRADMANPAHLIEVRITAARPKPD